MAMVIDQEFPDVSDVRAVLDFIRDTLYDWPYWDHILEHVQVNPGQSDYYTIFYIDSAGTTGVGVGEYSDEPYHTTGYAGIIKDGTFVRNVLNSIIFPCTIHIRANNTALYLAMSESTDITDVYTNNCFATRAVAQDGTNQLTSVVGTLDYSSNVIGYHIYAPGEETVVKTYGLQADAEYNCLLPLIGSPVGVCAGIFCPLMLEGDVEHISTITMHGKTFYICGNAVLIDYAVG